MQEDKRTAEEIISQLEKDYSEDDDAMEAINSYKDELPYLKKTGCELTEAYQLESVFKTWNVKNSIK